MLRESHRVLKPGGFLFVTTPNVLSLSNIFNLICGGNIYFPYSSDGVYARHNREFTPGELGDLLRLHNYEPTVVVDDVYSHAAFAEWLSKVGEAPDRKDNLFAVARATGPHVSEYPAWLYAGYKTRAADVSAAPSSPSPAPAAAAPQPVGALSEGAVSEILNCIATTEKAKCGVSS
jgi:hypothetical protein